MWILAGLLAALAIALIFQETTGNLERPWMECKESLVQQMFSDSCTPRTGIAPAPQPQGTGETPPADPADRPVGEIKLN
jgi:hypothetical protein